MAEQKGFFDMFFGAGQAVIDAARKSLIKSANKRMFHSAYDDATGKILTLTKQRDELRMNWENLDVNAIIKKTAEIEAYKTAQKLLMEEYEVYFGKPMQIRENDED